LKFHVLCIILFLRTISDADILIIFLRPVYLLCQMCFCVSSQMCQCQGKMGGLEKSTGGWKTRGGPAKQTKGNQWKIELGKTNSKIVLDGTSPATST